MPEWFFPWPPPAETVGSQFEAEKLHEECSAMWLRIHSEKHCASARGALCAVHCGNVFLSSRRRKALHWASTKMYGFLCDSQRGLHF